MLRGPGSVDRHRWNEAVLRSDGSFLQSFEWGEFQSSLGREVVRLRSPTFQALLIKHKLPLGKSYLYCPRGPLALRPGGPDKRVLGDFLKHVDALGEGATFLRIEPEWRGRRESESLLKEYGFSKSGVEIQPAKTIIVDISRSESEILALMKPKTRYNIRLGGKKGLSLKRLGREDDEAFLNLLDETSKRDRFSTYPKWYYRRMLDFFDVGHGTRPFVELWGAVKGSQLLAANLTLFWNKRAIYLHGASSSQDRNLMAPYLLHWEVLKRAREKEYSEYDLWGISERWPGVTRFKRGFGGTEVEYAGCYELAFDHVWHRLYKLLRGIL